MKTGAMRRRCHQHRIKQRDQTDPGFGGSGFCNRRLWGKRKRIDRLGTDLIGKARVQRHLLVLQQANHQQRHNPRTEAANQPIKDARNMSHRRQFLSFALRVPVLMRSQMPMRGCGLSEKVLPPLAPGTADPRPQPVLTGLWVTVCAAQDEVAFASSRKTRTRCTQKALRLCEGPFAEWRCLVAAKAFQAGCRYI